MRELELHPSKFPISINYAWFHTRNERPNCLYEREYNDETKVENILGMKNQGLINYRIQERIEPINKSMGRA